MDVKLIIKYLFLFPYIGGILAVVSLFVPVASRWYHSTIDNSYIIWLWGLLTITEWYHGTGWAWETTFVYNPYLFIQVIGIIVSILIFIVAIKIILKARNYGQEEKFLDITFLKDGAIMLGIIIAWMIIIEIFYSIIGFLDVSPPFSFWSYFDAQFGVIGIIIGGIFSMLGFVIFKIYYKKFYYLYM